MDIEKGWRIRVNVATTVNNVKTKECTVEGYNQTDEEVIARLNGLVVKLDEVYPTIPREVKK